jgi:hypothetical protein
LATAVPAFDRDVECDAVSVDGAARQHLLHHAQPDPAARGVIRHSMHGKWAAPCRVPLIRLHRIAGAKLRPNTNGVASMPERDSRRAAEARFIERILWKCVRNFERTK